MRTDTYKRLSVDGAISRYAPSFQNNTARYKDFIDKSLGIPGTTLMSELTPQQFNALVNGIRTQEGWIPGAVSHIAGPGK